MIGGKDTKNFGKKQYILAVLLFFCNFVPKQIISWYIKNYYPAYFSYYLL